MKQIPGFLTACVWMKLNQCFMCVSQSCLRSERDYESVVLMRLRQAEERKRLIEEMKREEEQEMPWPQTDSLLPLISQELHTRTSIKPFWNKLFCLEYLYGAFLWQESHVRAFHSRFTEMNNVYVPKFYYRFDSALQKMNVLLLY